MNIPVGKTFVYGTSPENARALLAAARRLGLDASIAVRTVEDGFVVPNAVADELANAPDVEERVETPAEPVSDPGPSDGFDVAAATYNELKVEAARRFGPGAGAGSKEELRERLSGAVKEGD